VAARVLKSLAQSGETGLRRQLDLPAIESAIASNAGLAMLPEPEVTDLPEVDFLGFGCPKRQH
ncbi:MAG: hypothetical protein ACRES4_09215, partial [Nevskiales bacterium]